MFVRKMSGTVVRGWLPDNDGDLVEQPRIDGLEKEPDPEEMQAAQKRYEEFLASQNFSGAGDLLPFFAQDFFHDASFEDFRIDGSAMRVQFRAGVLVDGQEGGARVFFNVIFDKVVWLSVESVTGDYGSYSFGEIDGLDDRIEQAQERFDGVFHSLTIETGWGAWIALVFRSVRVQPVNEIEWMRILRNSSIKLPGLYGVE